MLVAPDAIVAGHGLRERAAIARLGAAGLPVSEVRAHRDDVPSHLVLQWIEGEPLSAASPLSAQREAGRLLRRVHAQPERRPDTIGEWMTGWTSWILTRLADHADFPAQRADEIRADEIRDWCRRLQPLMTGRGTLISTTAQVAKAERWYETAMELRRFVAPVAVGVVVAAVFGVWGFTTRHSATADVVEGWAMPNASGTAIALHDSNDSRAGTSYVVVGASWAGRDGLWHEGVDGPTCVGTDTATKTHVRLGIVDVEAGQEGVGGPRVMWLRCLS